MLRGRHRGLPLAIDRAVILPTEFDQQPGPDRSMRWADEAAEVVDQVAGESAAHANMNGGGHEMKRRDGLDEKGGSGNGQGNLSTVQERATPPPLPPTSSPDWTRTEKARDLDL